MQKILGLGLLEQTYEICLTSLLNSRGLKAQRQVECPIEFNGQIIHNAYRMDILVEDQLIIEVKAIEELKKIHEAQILTYMRFSRKPLGLLINFHTAPLRNGIKRFIIDENMK